MAAAGDAAGRAPRDVADATHDLYRQYGKQIYAYCLHQLRSREEAEDAVQTTFLNAFRGLQRGTTTRFEQAWLYKIAQNVCIARRSSSGRRLKLESPDDFEILQEVVPSSSSAGDRDTLELMGLDDALDSMPENQRRAILMREWQGLSYREIAAELDLSQGAVEMLIFRARRTLATALEQPAAVDKRRTSKAKTGFSFGSLVAAMKSLFSSGVALKMAAVAVSAAVVGTNSVVHSVISRVANQSKVHRAGVTPAPATARTFVPASRPAAPRVVFKVKAKPARAVRTQWHAAARSMPKPVLAPDVVPAAARPQPAATAPTPTATAAPASQSSAPAAAYTPPAPAPDTPAPSAPGGPSVGPASPSDTGGTNGNAGSAGSGGSGSTTTNDGLTTTGTTAQHDGRANPPNSGDTGGVTAGTGDAGGSSGSTQTSSGDGSDGSGSSNDQTTSSSAPTAGSPSGVTAGS